MSAAAQLDEPEVALNPQAACVGPPPRDDGCLNIAFLALWILLAVLCALGATR